MQSPTKQNLAGKTSSDMVYFQVCAKTGLSCFHSWAAVRSGSFNCTWWHDLPRTHGCPKVHAVLMGFFHPPYIMAPNHAHVNLCFTIPLVLN
jgi:hypothetical protein